MAETTPVQPSAKIKTVPLQARGSLDSQINTWKWQAKDKNGALVEFAPGSTWCVMRGPTSKGELIEKANGLLYNARVEKCTNGEEDPEFQIVPESITPIGKSKAELGHPGALKKLGLIPLTLGVGLSYPEIPETV